jgi:hypothetical protein
MGQAKSRGSRDQRIAAARAIDTLPASARVDLKAVDIDPGPAWQRFAQLIKVATANGAKDVADFARAFRQPNGELVIRVAVKGLPSEDLVLPAGSWNERSPEDKAEAVLNELKGRFERTG